MATVTKPRSARQPLLTPEDLAELFGVTKDWIHKTLVYERRIDYIKVGGRVRFTQEALERYLERQTRQAAP